MNNDPKRRLSRPEVPGISAIFNPRKLRRNSTAVSQLLGSSHRHPSVVVTDDHLEVDFSSGSSMIGSGSVSGGGGGPGMANGPGGSGSAGGGGHHHGHGHSSSVPLLADVQQQSGIITIESSLISAQQQQQQMQQQGSNANLKPIARTLASIRRAIFSKTARKLCCGLFLSILVGLCWTFTIHLIKWAYQIRFIFQEDLIMAIAHPSHGGEMSQSQTSFAFDTTKVFTSMGDSHNFNTNSNVNQSVSLKEPSSSSMPKTVMVKAVYDAPFFTAWVLTMCTCFFYPIHQITVRFCSCMGRKGPKSMSRAVSDAVQGFRERGMTLFQFLGRCTVLCCLWLLTNWLIVASLRVLKATEVLALFATTTSFVYLLSWVVLHYQFVGLRILAVILSNMGIALFAYMDGQTHKSKTVGGVILGATAAGSSAVFKVSLKKSFGFGATISQQVAFIFSMVGIISIVIMWPIFVTLYFTGIEVIKWSYVPWELIIGAVFAFLLVSMLDNFGVTCTFEFFISVGLLMAIPFSAVVDVHWYQVEFDGMCLAGIIVISIGFCIVLLPENWPDYITRLIRRFRGPPEEEKHPEPSHSALPRLSRAGLDVLVNPPGHSHNNSVTNSNTSIQSFLNGPPNHSNANHLNHHNNNNAHHTNINYQYF